MDIFSLFSRSPEKQIGRLRRKVIEPHGDPSTRMGAAERLYEMGSAPALRALLDRFTITVSPSTQDETEKEALLSWIIRRGRDAVGPLLEYVRQERQIFWPVKALQRILPEPEFAREMASILRFHWESPPASSDPTVQLIRLLENVSSPELDEVVELFLEHEADDVRLAALDFLFAREGEKRRTLVLECYVDSEERPRVRNHILENLVEKGWSVRGFRPAVEESLPEGFVLTRDGRVKETGR